MLPGVKENAMSPVDVKSEQYAKLVQELKDEGRIISLRFTRPPAPEDPEAQSLTGSELEQGIAAS
jgi:hypothetical protein